MSEPAPRRVAVLSTGGTIASVHSRDADGARVALAISEILGSVGDAGVKTGPVLDLARVNSWNVDPGLMWRVAATIERLTARNDVDGVVVTHGTDTIEETAFVADVLTRTDKPVVFTAAMRSADALSADGPHNLATALRAAGSPAMRGLGVTVCLDDEVHAARWVRKWHTHRTGALTSVTGPVATVDPDGGVRRFCGALPRWTAPATDVEGVDTGCVPVVQAYTGMSPAILRAVVDAASARGLVIEGFGLGHVPGALINPVRDFIAAGVVVVISTRVPTGGTWPVYGGSGGGTDLTASGALAAGGLSAAKARLLLLACLTGQNPVQGAQTFREAVAVLGRGSEGDVS